MKLKDLLLVADCKYFRTSLQRNQKGTVKRLSRYDCITCGSRLEHNDWIEECI